MLKKICDEIDKSKVIFKFLGDRLDFNPTLIEVNEDFLNDLNIVSEKFN